MKLLTGLICAAGLAAAIYNPVTGWVTPAGYSLPTDGLIINYDMTEGSGQTLSDSSGLGNDASLGDDGTTETEDPTWSTAGGETILDFVPGDFDRVTLPNVSSSFSGAGTVIVAVRTDAYPQTFEQGGLWWLGTDASFGDLYTHNNSFVYLGALSTGRKTVGDTGFNTTAWHVLAVTSTGSAFQVFQNNTSRLSSGTNTFGITTTPLLGNDRNGKAFDGKMAWFLLYNKVLNSTELKDAFCYIRQEKPGLSIADNGC